MLSERVLHVLDRDGLPTRPVFGAGGRGGHERTAVERSAPGEGHLDPTTRAVLDGVEAGHGVDTIAGAGRLPAADVRAALGRLELMGLIARDGLSSYHRTAR